MSNPVIKEGIGTFPKVEGLYDIPEAAGWVGAHVVTGGLKSVSWVYDLVGRINSGSAHGQAGYPDTGDLSFRSEPDFFDSVSERAKSMAGWLGKGVRSAVTKTRYETDSISDPYGCDETLSMLLTIGWSYGLEAFERLKGANTSFFRSVLKSVGADVGD